MALEPELSAALEAADVAGRIILDLYARWSPLADAPAAISTQADRDSQEAILTSLRRHFPDDAYRAEEATPTLTTCRRAGSRMWIIDPIDGTRGFATKNGEFSVMIALVENGAAVVGVVLEPAIQRTTYAVKGGGCWAIEAGAQPRPVRVTTTTDSMSWTLTQSHSKPGRPTTAAVRLLKPKMVLETYSAGIKLAQVARGEADLYVCEYSAMNDWDIAAGAILVYEAGGRLTNGRDQDLIFGQEEPLQTGGLLASNGLIHAAALLRLGDSLTA